MAPYRLLSLALILALGLLAAIPSHTVVADDLTSTKGFRKAVTVAGIREHQATLQSIADANEHIRASGTPSYDIAAQYVYDQLAAHGYSPRFQEFEFAFFRKFRDAELNQVAPNAQPYPTGTFFYSAAGEVITTIQAVDVTVPPVPGQRISSGCEMADFAGFTRGNIALLQRGSCSFGVKTANAEAAGAAAVIIFNDGLGSQTEVAIGTLGAPGIGIPAVGASYLTGEGLYRLSLSGPHAVRVMTDTESDYRRTVNVIAETPSGDADHVVVVGAHLDAVTSTPGIGDNGSGVATTLEIAKQLALHNHELRNKVRFIWFGADEPNLQGSAYYINSLSQAERDKIELFLNIEALDAPNFARFVFDGNNSAFPAGPGVARGPQGSGDIERVLQNYFASEQLAVDPTPFNNRSAHWIFVHAGIPTGGFFSGSDGIKTAEQAAIYGGTAGRAYNPCHRIACDTLDNSNTTALDQLSDATAHAVLYFARRDFAHQPLTD